jgi:DNA repair protein RecN (Recombination protein N)
MLLQLNITNFALIENLSISFEQGFNVLSGETGAGKSILIDAINFVLGEKFNKDLIRTGENKTFVEAIFTIENEKTREVLTLLDIDYDDLLIISREAFQSGKTVAKVNGKSLVLSNIKLISSTLLDIHGQHENQHLLDVSNHISYLDYYGSKVISDQIDNYRIGYRRYVEIISEIERLSGHSGENEKLIDFYKYQIDEINMAKLKADEDIELEKEFSVLNNAEKISSILESCYIDLFSGDDNVSSIYDKMSYAIRELRSIEKHMDKIGALANSLQDMFYNLEENVKELRNLKEGISYDEEELNYINSRMYQITSLKKKYGKSIEEILNYRDKIAKQYDELVNINEIIEKLKTEKERLFNSLRLETNKLHKLRSKVALELEAKIKEELDYVGLEKSTFKISILLVDDLNENGSDKVQFLISTNPGEPLKSMEKVVSGGELSRIMLALKTVFVNKDKIPSVIFDEIDTGISGRIAQSVAEKMYIISCSHQVFCVTHLPQIACISDVHYLITKSVEQNKTFTSIDRLDKSKKEMEIARMIGGSEVTKLTLEHSKEMIELADNKKIFLKNSK